MMKLCIVIFCVCVFATCTAVPPAQVEDKLRAWGDKFGDDLKAVSQIVTNVGGLQQSYRTHNARVDKETGPELLKEIVENLSRMVRKKIQAVQCLRAAAEEQAENFDFNTTTLYNFTYTSMKLAGEVEINPYANVSFPEMNLEPNRHFYNIKVSMDESGIHVPTNVYDRYLRVAEDIEWSEGMKEAFINNSKSDPSLSFQYFGSPSGVLRLYPAMEWKTGDVDLYDCRTRPWFIEAATCTKDAIILMDKSGSMTGMRSTISKLVVQKLLETFSINDFINVYKFSWLPEPVLTCFNDTLIPATRENIKILQDAVEGVAPDGNASFPHAFTHALNLLERVRLEREEEGSPACNQAIMLVTDSLPGNITEVFERLNVNENGTRIVRVFTYLLGIEVIGVDEIQDVACDNRGYYVHVHNLDEVNDQVLKYIPVISRPLVLQEKEHPVSWTHAFANTEDPKLSKWLWTVMENEEQKERLKVHEELAESGYFSNERQDEKYVQHIEQFMEPDQTIFYQEYELMAAISVPAYDKKRNHDEENQRADLLGIAGLDIPLDEFRALMYPYKVGVNGYAFIITNNGYLLVHPDLRPVYMGMVKTNFHSVDLAEAEFEDNDEYGEGNYSESIIQIRDAMVGKQEESFDSLEIKSHLEDFHRVYTEQRYFSIAPLPDTPYSVGLVLPSDYGNFLLGVNDELNNAKMERPSRILEYFEGKNWSVHPEWTYCKYHLTQSHGFKTPEDELLHFLKKMTEVNWKWQRQYEEDEIENNEIVGADDDTEEEEEGDEEVNEDDDMDVECDRREVGENEYYCDRDLIQLLLFDAKVLSTFEDVSLPRLIRDLLPTVRFVATQSGLTRWQYLSESKSRFNEYYKKTIDEAWYKQAVLQHKIDRDSFVFSIPFNVKEVDDLYVTATQAVFPRDGGKEAPASVVGFQFTYQSFYDKFFTMVDPVNGLTCAALDISCYVLDHNGYVMISENENDTSKFFGEIQKDVMEDLVEDGLYRKIVIFDYQGLCMKITNIGENSTASFITTPFNLMVRTTEWLIIDVLWSFLQNLIYQTYNIQMAYSYPSADLDVEEADDEEYDDDLEADEFLVAEQEIPLLNINDYFGPDNIRNTWPCNEYHELFLLQQNSTEKTYHHPGVPEHWVKKIRHTNLIIVAVSDDNYAVGKMMTGPFEFSYEDCHRYTINLLNRTRSSSCYTYHPLEDKITGACGDGSKVLAVFSLLLLTIAVMFV